MTRSPRLIGIEFGHRFDPEERVALAVRVQLCDLRRNPAAHGFRARIRHKEAQFAQPLAPTPRAHQLHSFGRRGHLIPPSSVTRHYVTRYTPERNGGAAQLNRGARNALRWAASRGR